MREQNGSFCCIWLWNLRNVPPADGVQNAILQSDLTVGLYSGIVESMNHVGALIEARRRHLGLSRHQVANRVGVSSQTVLNLEKKNTYNLGTSLLRRLEEALQISFEITIKEERTMRTEIQMGNDEFILYIRKNHPTCATSNDRLGKEIWRWLKNCDTKAVKVPGRESEPCLWGITAANIHEAKLPKTATQFQFERKLLPDLYEFLDALGSGVEQHLTTPTAVAAQ